MDGHRTQLRFVEPARGGWRVESRKEIEYWIRDRSAALAELLREVESTQLTLDERRAA